jgi:hypothetical protein
MAQRFSGWGSWLLMAWGAGVVAYALWQWSRVAFALFLGAAIVIATRILLNRRKRRLRGYWVEYVSPGLLRAGENEFGIVYHEGPERLFFYGIQRPKPDRNLLFIPREQWDSTVAAWARGRRDLIVERLQADPIVKRCEITESKA